MCGFMRSLFCLLLVSFSVCADDAYPILQTLDGTRYTNANISSVTAAYAIFLYDGGGCCVALSNLPPDAALCGFYRIGVGWRLLEDSGKDECGRRRSNSGLASTNPAGT